MTTATRTPRPTAPVDPAVRLKAVTAECRRRSAAAVTSADFDLLLCVQDELAMCRCLVAGVVA